MINRLLKITTALNALRKRIHSDQRGTISILSIFALLAFTMLLMMVVNVAKHVDDKIKMQNAADASAYSGGVVLARGMNSVAYTNHLLCDVFAITAFLRESRDRNAEKVIPQVLDAWEQMAPKFQGAQFAKFPPLSPAIPEKIPHEREAVTAWSDMMATASEETLPVFETILQEQLIPQFQREVIATIPQLAAETTMEIAMRHGLSQQNQQAISAQIRNIGDPTERKGLIGVLWRTDVVAINRAVEESPNERTLPIVNPDPAYGEPSMVPDGGDILTNAKKERRDWSKRYLGSWVRDRLSFFRNVGKMSQFNRFFHIAACGQLDRLLNEEYPDSNLPMMIRPNSSLDHNQWLEADFQYVAVAYRRHLKEMAPGMFRNPLRSQADALTFAQIEIFLPRRRSQCCPWQSPVHNFNGDIVDYQNRGDTWPRNWDTFSQNWTVRLSPATNPAVFDIVQSTTNEELSGVRLPNLGALTRDDFEVLNTH